MPGASRSRGPGGIPIAPALEQARQEVKTLQRPVVDTSSIRRVGYLGPEGTWTHQATLDLFAQGVELLPFADGLFKAYEDGTVDAICAPVATSLVGATPYLDDILALRAPVIVAEYPKMLSYSLIATRQATFDSIRKVVGHKVALDEIGAWLDVHMPNVDREARHGATAFVASRNSPALASIGPGLGAKLFDLQQVRTGIEEGIHNVTRWWVLGRNCPLPTGRDRTSVHLKSLEAEFMDVLNALSEHNASVLNIYQRPTRAQLDAHQYVIDIAGHSTDPSLDFLREIRNARILGSYPRAY